MTIKKYQGKTEDEAIEKAKEDLGPGAVIMNTKEVKQKGFLKFFKSPTYEVTAAVEDTEQFLNAIQLAAAQQAQQNRTLSANPPQEVKEEKAEQKQAAEQEEKKQNSESEIEKKLETLANMLEKKLAEEGLSAGGPEPALKTEEKNTENSQFIRMLYRTFLDNDVNEKYANQILEEAEKVTFDGGNVDYILSNVYQKMILKLGQPNCIKLSGKRPRVIFFIGPTGVGKTTTIAKLAAKYKVEYQRRIAMLTADTYRIAAAEQLKIYANILDAPVKIIYSAEELNRAVEVLSDNDLIFVDTAGFSHKNMDKRDDIKKLIDGLDSKYEKETYLVVSAATKYKDLMEIVDTYKQISDYKIIFTKLDETSAVGNILNIRLYSGADLSYMTNGQSVPDDLEIFDMQMIVKQLLGGK